MSAGFDIDAHGLSVHFGATRAVDDVTVSLQGGTIIGLLGRNGAGKTTLLETIAAFRRPTSGVLLVDGEDPYEDRRLMSEMCLVVDNGWLEDSISVKDALGIARELRPRWADDVAERLIERFEIPNAKKVGALSRGKRSALAVTIGIATRAPLTMFDEPHLGMDAPSRYAFYDELLADYVEHPRTIVVSTHLIDEMASLLEDVVILDRGKVLTHQTAEALQARGVEITGPESAVVYGHFNGELREHASAVGVELGPIPLQDLFVSLTSEEKK